MKEGESSTVNARQLVSFDNRTKLTNCYVHIGHFKARMIRNKCDGYEEVGEDERSRR